MFRTISILLVLSMMAGCCARRAVRLAPVPDALQSYVIIGFNKPCKCPLPWREKPLLLDKGKAALIWIRSVHRDALLKPEADKEVHYEAINDFGESMGQQLSYFGTITTDKEGFGQLPEFRPQKIGTYRIKVDFKDRFTRKVVYSESIIVIR